MYGYLTAKVGDTLVTRYVYGSRRWARPLRPKHIPGRWRIVSWQCAVVAGCLYGGEHKSAAAIGQRETPDLLRADIDLCRYVRSLAIVALLSGPRDAE